MDGTSTKENLLAALHQNGILMASPTQPVRSRDGKPGRWMLDSLSVTLTAEGVEQAGKQLLELLEKFEGRQIATYGVTAIPLLTSCVLQSKGRYNGLIVRSARKDYGSSKLIEGRIDPNEPVIFVDDSVSSGTNMEACCDILEETGLRVEGGVCLVRFGWYGGFARMQERGYHMESVFDIWENFIYLLPNEPDRVGNPTKIFPSLDWGQDRLPDDLDPAQIARLTIEQCLRGEPLSLSPDSLKGDFDAVGGAWVSVRSKENVHRRHARDGFWNFPEDSSETTPRSIVLAAAKTANAMPQGDRGLNLLEQSAIAVTFFSELQPCHVGDLDNGRYGIVVRSQERPSKMGGALPRMPGISNAWQQFQHARRKNAGLVSFEPYELLRHDVVKFVEAGANWQPTGVPTPPALSFHDAPDFGDEVANFTRNRVLAALDLPSSNVAMSLDGISAEQIDSVYVTVYILGRICGCMGCKISSLAADLDKLASLAVADERFTAPEDCVQPEHVSVTVSLLYDPLTLGEFKPEEVIHRLQDGRQALMAYQGNRFGLLLPQVAAANSLSRLAYAHEVIDKAGITRAPYNWQRYDCTTWLATADREARILRGTEPLENETTPGDLKQLLPKLATLFSNYLLKHQKPDGRMYFRYLPSRNVLYEGGDLPRTAHCAWVLCRAGRQFDHQDLLGAGKKLTSNLIQLMVEEEDGHWLREAATKSTIAELSFLILALTDGQQPIRKCDKLAEGLAATLWNGIDRHGIFTTHRDKSVQSDAFQDYFPGQALLALAAACEAGLTKPDHEKLTLAFGNYQHRFRYKRNFGAVSWLMQAFSRWYRQTDNDQFSGFVLEMGDWILRYQQKDSGGFINDHQADTPGYTTLLYLEGLGAATRLAEEIGDVQRAAQYREACRLGFEFVDGLVIQSNMIALLPNPDWAIGGVRQSVYRDDVRIDFVQHGLSAVTELYR